MNQDHDLVCLSHLRWGFVYQRPQHLMTRAARNFRVFFVEEPFFEDCEPHYKEFLDEDSKVKIIAPYLPKDVSPEAAEKLQAGLLGRLFADHGIRKHVLWYYTPMALNISRSLNPSLIVYDCMDELSGFKGAPPILREREQELFRTADLVFTGGHSLYEAKRGRHPRVYPFPSSIDFNHFAQARNGIPKAADQAAIPRPRIGYCGVIDERMDFDLLAEVARLRPDFHFVMLGPVVKINADQLPRTPNIHYLGPKNYKELPSYLGGWDVAMLPFARNEATRFISPTKTPEYLAAGRPAISTSIQDVVRPYGERELVYIADAPHDFVAAIEKALAMNKAEWLARVDDLLKMNSWDITWSRMLELMNERTAA